MRRPSDWGPPCPHVACPLVKRLNRGHVSARSPSMTASGKRRIVRGPRGATTVAETQGPVFCDLRTSAATGRLAVKMRLVRVERSGIACGRGVPAATVLA
jgi:hypothetical protein